MATIHVCDRCGASVKARDDLWVVEISPMRKQREHYKTNLMEDAKRYTRREVCKKCRDHLYVELMGGAA